MRFVPKSADDAVQRLTPLLADGGQQVQGFFVVLDRDTLRRRPLPEQGAPS